MSSPATPHLSPLEAKLSEKLKNSEPKTSLRDIYQMRYKRGPVTHDICFKLDSTGDLKEDGARALRLATRYVSFLGNRDNSKVILVGVPKPLALDLEQEMKSAEIS